MSKEELLTAYAEGSISRRIFVRRLVATGVGAGTAVSYAQLLAPPAEARSRRGGELPPGSSDHYPLLTMKVMTRDISNVRQRQQLKVKVIVSESAIPRVAAFVKRRGDLAYLGSAPPPGLIDKGTSRTLVIPIDTKHLKGKRSAEVYINATIFGADAPYLSSLASTKATLK